jgi:hypothetical protein
MLHGLIPDGMIDNDGVPFALKPGEGEPHVHTPFCERMALSVDDGWCELHEVSHPERPGCVNWRRVVVWSLGGDDDDQDQD